MSTVHGLYSVNAYSAIMAKAEHIIAISDCVQSYIVENYGVPPERITRIFRGLDPSIFQQGQDSQDWWQQLLQNYPRFEGRHLLLMPGRLSRWKGQEAFLKMMAHLVELRDDCHGVVIGEAEENKQHYLQELLDLRHELALDDRVTFVGHRSDIQAFYARAALTCHMSNKAEPFGRTVPEALACGCPVVAFDRGGAAESLHAAFPQGLVEADNIQAFAQRIDQLLTDGHGEIRLPDEFFLQHQVEATLGVYRQLLETRPA